MEHGPEFSLLVESVHEPVQYRVYPETPLSEVVDLMVRREVNALPVVGEDFEFLGIITVGDALRQVLRHGPVGETIDPENAPAARDIMKRSVLCVSESQPLAEAAQMMVNRRVHQIPVVREGQLIGMLTRDAILRALHPGSQTTSEDTEGDT